jgi:hypothetical protein
MDGALTPFSETRFDRLEVSLDDEKRFPKLGLGNPEKVSILNFQLYFLQLKSRDMEEVLIRESETL